MGSAKASSDFDRGRRIGKYEILTRLSMGGMAELYLAFLPGPGGFKKFVAVKQILPDVKRDEAFVKMFLDEARITAAFSHANIGQVFDLGEDEQSHELYLAMEFIAGQNLEQVLRRAAKNEVPVPTGFAARVIRDTVLALHYAHHFQEPSTGMPMPVVHRDISPKNVMITYTGDVKVIDFGIAKARGRLNRTQVGIVKGTSGYMAPEQVKNQTLDGRADLFATAVMLHELLCGERLFTAPNDAAMMLKIVEGEVQAPGAVNPYVGHALSDAVLKGLEKDRERRYSTGKEFARAIEQSCPELFEEEQVADFMRHLFEDKITLTRSILEMANEEKVPGNLTAAVEGLTQEEQDAASGPKPKKATNGVGLRDVATPAPRPGLRGTGSSQRLPKVASRAMPSSQRLPAVTSGPKSTRGLQKVGDSRRSMTGVPEDEPAASKRSKAKLPPISEDTPPPKARSSAKGAVPDDLNQPGAEAAAADEVAAAHGSRSGLVAAAVVVLALLGGGGWAITKGPLRGVIDKATTDESIPVDTGPQKITASAAGSSGERPSWVLEKEAEAQRLAEEQQRMKEIEEAASDPDRLKLIEEITAQLAQLNRLEEEQRQLKVESRQGKQTNDANSKKIEDLQRQIVDLKNIVNEKQARAAQRTGKQVDRNAVTVIKDGKSAKAADIGYLTFTAFNPSSVSVYAEETLLGTTPLIKVPLDVGVHRLRVVDGDSKNRFLSVTIEAGKTVPLNLDVSSIPLGN